jgi:hypothetical protein
MLVIDILKIYLTFPFTSKAKVKSTYKSILLNIRPATGGKFFIPLWKDNLDYLIFSDHDKRIRFNYKL